MSTTFAQRLGLAALGLVHHPSDDASRGGRPLDRTCVETHDWGVPTVVFGCYEWDADKNATNHEEHGVSFLEAATALQDPQAAYLDVGHDAEQRYAAIGVSAGARVLYVVHVERGERDRIISARLATDAEHALYTDG
jgi:uncharacterized DUF497 family protein